jgi:hypothetical protein
MISVVKAQNIMPNVIAIIFAALSIITSISIFLKNPDIGALLWLGTICGAVITAFVYRRTV